MIESRDDGIRERKTKDILQTDDEKHEIRGGRIATVDHYGISLREDD